MGWVFILRPAFSHSGHRQLWLYVLRPDTACCWAGQVRKPEPCAAGGVNDKAQRAQGWRQATLPAVCTEHRARGRRVWPTALWYWESWPELQEEQGVWDAVRQAAGLRGGPGRQQASGQPAAELEADVRPGQRGEGELGLLRTH